MKLKIATTAAALAATAVLALPVQAQQAPDPGAAGTKSPPPTYPAPSEGRDWGWLGLLGLVGLVGLRGRQNNNETTYRPTSAGRA